MLLKVGLLAAGLAALVVLLLWGWSLLDRAEQRAIWRGLRVPPSGEPKTFDLSMIEGLPEPAQRFFRFALKPNSKLHTAVELEMVGDFSLGDAEAPNTMPMTARQILAPPAGFIWSMKAGRGLMRLSGSDGLSRTSSWSRFRLFGLIPVARAGGDSDHLRSAFGRAVAESLFWTPAATLPGPAVRWENVDENTARMTMHRGDLEQAVDLTVDAAGRPTQVVFQRWSDANEDHTFRRQPFGGVLSEFKTFDGTTVPTRVVAGNHFGTEDYFPFFSVHVTSFKFVAP